MAVDIGLSGDKPEVHLVDDGYYWFLHPLLEGLHAQTGEYIDLYGVARFGDQALSELRATLTSAREQVVRKPSEWDVHTGTQTHPEVRELFAKVSRDAFLGLLDRLLDLVERALRDGREVVCTGD